MMNKGIFNQSLSARIKNLIFPDKIMTYLETMRKAEFYSQKRGLVSKFIYSFMLYKYQKLGIQLGFSIGLHTLGYGVSIPHYGTIVVGSNNTIGRYAVLHTCTCITSNGSKIGDALNLCTGSIITKKVVLGDNISVCANSIVNRNFETDNILIGGGISKIIKDYPAWYIADGPIFLERVKQVEQLKKKMKL